VGGAAPVERALFEGGVGVDVGVGGFEVLVAEPHGEHRHVKWVCQVVAEKVHGAVVKGNPADGPMLAPAIGRIKARFGQAPKAVTADRGYGEAKIDADLEASGVKTVAIPRKGRPGATRQAVQRGRGFVKLVKWRTGCEGRISTLKRDWGWARTLMDGETGPRPGAGGVSWRITR
jgi:IS5 family transposase